MNRLKQLCFELFSFMNIQTTASTRLYTKAKSLLGTHVAYHNLVPKAVECAETVSTILNDVWGFPIITGTYTLLEAFKNSQDFVEVSYPLPGDITMYATGDGGGKNGVTNGHTGIVGDVVPNTNDRYVMSNNSITGLFDTHFTLTSMHERYAVLGGFHEHYFRRITN